MDLLIYSILSWLILMFFGLNLCILFLPDRLKKYSLLVAPILGYCFIVFVSYYCYRLNFDGTNSYAWPVTLVVIACSLYVFLKNISFLKEIFNKEAFIGLGFSIVSWIALSTIFFIFGSPLVSLALSNLDVAELAVESRFLQEFNRTSEIGFLGQTGWLKVVGDDIWFGPSAIVAFLGTLLRIEPYKAQSLILHVLVAQGAGIFYLLIRFFSDITKRVSLGVTFLYTISPVIIYTAWQSFGGQSIAIPIVLLITRLYLDTTQKSQEGFDFRTLLSLILLFSALLVTYHFMALIIFFLISVHCLVMWFYKRHNIQTFKDFKFLLILVIAVAFFNPYRIISVVETFSMVAISNNGWFIPWLNPFTQIGIYTHRVFYGGYSLEYYKYLIYPATLIFLATLVAYLRTNNKKKITEKAFFYGLFLPVILLGGYFALIGSEGGQLGGYRSFKITSTFIAFTFIVFALPFTNSFFEKRGLRTFVVELSIVALVISSVWSLSRFLHYHKSTIYILPKEIIELQKIEKMDQINGLNILDFGNFSNLWANYFLLNKAHVFQKFPYGGRVVGDLNQPFTLIRKTSEKGSESTHILSVRSDVDSKNRMDINQVFALQDTATKGFYTLTHGDGWWEPEPNHQWSGRSGSLAEIILDVQTEELLVLEVFHARLRQGDSIKIFLDGKLLKAHFLDEEFISEPFKVYPGRHIIRFVQGLAPSSPSSHDGRSLGVLWKSIVVVQQSK